MAVGVSAMRADSPFGSLHNWDWGGSLRGPRSVESIVFARERSAGCPDIRPSCSVFTRRYSRGWVTRPGRETNSTMSKKEVRLHVHLVLGAGTAKIKSNIAASDDQSMPCR